MSDYEAHNFTFAFTDLHYSCYSTIQLHVFDTNSQNNDDGLSPT